MRFSRLRYSLLITVAAVCGLLGISLSACTNLPPLPTIKLDCSVSTQLPTNQRLTSGQPLTYKGDTIVMQMTSANKYITKVELAKGSCRPERIRFWKIGDGRRNPQLKSGKDGLTVFAQMCDPPNPSPTNRTNCAQNNSGDLHIEFGTTKPDGTDLDLVSVMIAGPGA
jgi:hypothetical protein